MIFTMIVNGKQFRNLHTDTESREIRTRFIRKKTHSKATDEYSARLRKNYIAFFAIRSCENNHYTKLLRFCMQNRIAV